MQKQTYKLQKQHLQMHWNMPS